MTISLGIGLLGIIITTLLEIISKFIYTSVNVTIFAFLFTMRFIVKLQRTILFILKLSKAGTKLINGYMYGI